MALEKHGPKVRISRVLIFRLLSPGFLLLMKKSHKLRGRISNNWMRVRLQLRELYLRKVKNDYERVSGGLRGAATSAAGISD